ncbi:MAG: phosphopyruvate hydratase [Deltaproteobacteria bacterium]|nr:phosphopyruvate hydratase [Deltaproteobacteria bacterium]
MQETIRTIEAYEILTGPGRPTVEVELTTGSGIRVTASVPSGTSTGAYEAKSLFDGGTRFRGFGVKKAVENVNRIIAPALLGEEVSGQARIDRRLIELDGTPAKEKLGGNAILPVSLAVAKAAAAEAGLPLYRHLGGLGATRLPAPIATVIAGGAHSPAPLDFEDYLINLDGFADFASAVEALAAIHHTLGGLLKRRFGDVADSGGAYAPPLSGNEEAIETILEAVQKAGFAGQVSLGLDIVGTDLYVPERRTYRISGREMAAEEYTAYLVELTRRYPLALIEDAFHEDDFASQARLTALLPGKIIVGDDLFATNAARLARGIAEKSGNTLLLKVNQAGTLTEAFGAGVLARKNGFGVIVSLRSNDTNEDFIADLAVALGAEKIKLGGPVRGERCAKYNRLLRIEQQLGAEALFA